MRIHKYVLEVTDLQEIEMPKGRILSVDVQKASLCLWALVDTSSPLSVVKIRIIGTGNPIPSGALDNMAFVGTALMSSGGLVWHVFAAKA